LIKNLDPADHEELVEVAIDLVTECWRDIERVANELVKRRTLTGEQVAEILSDQPRSL
jgi:hypothetical protein